MPDIQFPNMYRVDLEKGPAIKQLHQMFMGDKAANRIGAYLFQGDAAVSPGGNCSGTAILNDGSTVALTGTVAGNEVYIDLPQGCYAVPGPIQVYVLWTNGTVMTTVVAGFGTVTRTETGTIIDPGTIIPSVSALIEAIDAAVESIPADYSALLASIAPTFSTTEDYAAGNYAWYNGTLYRFTANHAEGSWTGTDAAAAVIGNDLTDLKSALSIMANGLATASTLGTFEVCKLDPSSGNVQTATNRVSTPQTFTMDRTVTLSVATGFRYYILRYENGTNKGGTGWQTGTYDLLDGHEYKLMIARVTEITENARIEEFTSAITFENEENARLDNAESALSEFYKEYTPTLYTGAVRSTDGLYARTLLTKYYCVELNTNSIMVNVNSFTGNYGYALYDEDRNLISAAKTTANGEIIINTSGAKYFRGTVNGSTTPVIKCYGDVKDSIPIMQGESVNYALSEIITNAQSGSVINLPKGTFYVEDAIPLKSGISIIGSGETQTILNAKAQNVLGNNFIYAVFYRAETDKTPLDNIRISDLTIDRAETTAFNVGTKGLYAQVCRNSTFENLRLLNIPATGFGIDYLQNVLIKNVYCYNCGREFDTIGMGCSGIGIGTGYYDDESFIITDCICDMCGQAGIFIERQPETSGALLLGENQIVANNIVKNSKYGVLITRGWNVNVSGNLITNCENGITLRGIPKRVNCSGNTITKNTKGVSTESNTANGTVLIGSNVLAENDIAISMTPVAAAITGNYIVDSVTYDLSLTGDFVNKFTAKGNIQFGANDLSNASNYNIS